MNRPWTGFSHARIRKRLAAVALVAVVARALVPMGFMPVQVHGQTQIMFCDAGAPAAGADHGQHHHDAGSSPRGEAPCPFAMSGVAAPLPATLGLSLADAAPRLATHVVGLSVLPEAPPRHRAPRGPPALA